MHHLSAKKIDSTIDSRFSLVAVQYGCDLATIVHLVESDLSTLFARNKRGKTPLLLAVEFACATVQSDLQECPSPGFEPLRQDRLRPRPGAHPCQLETDFNTLCVVQELQVKGGLALDMGDLPLDNTPLHALVLHKGPGRLATLQVIMETCRFSKSDHSGSMPLPYYFIRYRLADKSTVLHLACQPPNFNSSLVDKVIQVEPRCTARKNKQGLTPLHLLAEPHQEEPCQDKPGANLGAFFQEGEANNMMLKMMDLHEGSATVADPSGRLPIHRYVESSCHESKDPRVLFRMLHCHPESCWIPSPTTGVPVVVPVLYDALLSRHQTNLQLPRHEYLNDMDDTNIEGRPDPTMVSLWLVLSHGHRVEEGGMQWRNEGYREHSEKLLQNGLTALKICNAILFGNGENAVPPNRESVLWQKNERIVNNVRCALRLIVHALFSALYKRAMLAWHDDNHNNNHNNSTVPPPGLSEHTWAGSLIDEMNRERQEVEDNLTLETRRAVNYLHRDSNTVAKCMALPMMQDRMFRFMFPTVTPACLQGNHQLCPVGKCISYIKWCKRHADIPCNINMSVLFGGVTDMFTVAMKLSQAPNVMGFLNQSEDVYGEEFINGFMALGSKLMAAET